MRRVVDRVGQERVDRRARLELPVVAVEDLDAGAVVDGGERIFHRAQLRGELFVRQAGDVEAAVAEGHVGDRLLARIALRVGAGVRRVRQRHLRVLHVLERHDLDLACAVDPEQRRLAVGALAAPHRDVGVTGARMHHHVGDGDFLRVGAEQPGNLLVDRLDGLSACRAAVGLVAKLERVDGGRLRVGGEQDAVGPEGQRTDGRHLRSHVRCRNRHSGRGPIARRPGKRQNSQRGQDLRTRIRNLLLR